MNQDLPPADIEAELAYLANALMIPGYLDEHPISPKDFHSVPNSWVLQAITALHERGTGIDAVTVSSELKAQGRGAEAREQLTQALSLPMDVTGDYERHIRECARRRRVINLARELVARAYDRTDDIDRLVSGVCSDLDATGADADQDDSTNTLRDMLKDSQLRASERGRKGVSDSVSLSTGHWKLDRDTGGFRPGTVTVFGAQSHWGKSSYALMVADLALAKGKRPLIVSAEDPEDMWADRWLTYRANIPRGAFEAGIFTKKQRDEMADTATAATDKLVFLNAIGRSAEWTARQVRALVRSEGIDLVMFDYLGAWVNEKTSGDDQRLRINYVSRTFTTVVKTTGVAGIIFSQITPSERHQPGMYSLRDSKDVANAAEVVMLGLKKDDDSRHILLAKNKPGPAKFGSEYQMGTNAASQCFAPIANVGDWNWNELDAPEWQGKL